MLADGRADVDVEELTAERPSLVDAVLGSAGSGAMAGAIGGFLWGGIGGRVAMRLVFLTSDDRVRGLTSDDGFEIGRFSPDTIALVVFATILGTIAGVLYGLVRTQLRGPRWLLAIAVGTAVGLGGGGLLVHADGVDFRVLEPLWLTVGLFVAIPAVWGVTVVHLAERLLTRTALFPGAGRLDPTRIGQAAAWGILLAITGWGLGDLARDVSRLT